MMFIDIYKLEFIHKNLRDILEKLGNEFGMFTITSLYRIGDRGIHGTLPLRAIDLRCRNKKIGKVIENWINKKWIYDPKRNKFKVCMFHDTGRGIHLHLQSHNNTIKR